MSWLLDAVAVIGVFTFIFGLAWFGLGEGGEEVDDEEGPGEDND